MADETVAKKQASAQATSAQATSAQATSAQATSAQATSANAEAYTKEEVSALMEKVTAELKDGLNREWQSRFDKILSEKKTVETKALTVEQRIEQIEKERQLERLSFSRETAKAKAQIDDDLHEAIQLYSGSDAGSIIAGAERIRKNIDDLIATKTEEAVKAALEKIGSQPALKSGSSVKGLTLEEFNKLDAKARAKYMADGGELVYK